MCDSWPRFVLSSYFPFSLLRPRSARNGIRARSSFSEKARCHSRPDNSQTLRGNAKYEINRARISSRRRTRDEAWNTKHRNCRGILLSIWLPVDHGTSRTLTTAGHPSTFLFLSDDRARLLNRRGQQGKWQPDTTIVTTLPGIWYRRITSATRRITGSKGEDTERSLASSDERAIVRSTEFGFGVKSRIRIRGARELTFLIS